MANTNINEQKKISGEIVININENISDNKTKTNNIGPNDGLNMNKNTLADKMDLEMLNEQDISVDGLILSRANARDTLTKDTKKTLSKETPESLARMDIKQLARWCRYHLEAKGDDKNAFGPIVQALSNIIDIVDSVKKIEELWKRSDVDDITDSLKLNIKALNDSVNIYKSGHSQNPFFKKGKMRSKLCWDILTPDYLDALQNRYTHEINIAYMTSIETHIDKAAKTMTDNDENLKKPKRPEIKKPKRQGVLKKQNDKFEKKLEDEKKKAKEFEEDTYDYGLDNAEFFAEIDTEGKEIEILDEEKADYEEYREQWLEFDKKMEEYNAKRSKYENDKEEFKKKYDEKLESNKRQLREAYKNSWIEKKKQTLSKKDPNNEITVDTITYEIRMSELNKSKMYQHYGITDEKKYLEKKEFVKRTNIKKANDLDSGLLGILKPVLFDSEGKVKKGYEENDAWNKAWLFSHSYERVQIGDEIIDNKNKYSALFRIPFFIDLVNIVSTITVGEMELWSDKEYFERNKNDILIKINALKYLDNMNGTNGETDYLDILFRCANVTFVERFRELKDILDIKLREVNQEFAKRGFGELAKKPNEKFIIEKELQENDIKEKEENMKKEQLGKRVRKERPDLNKDYYDHFNEFTLGKTKGAKKDSTARYNTTVLEEINILHSLFNSGDAGISGTIVKIKDSFTNEMMPLLNGDIKDATPLDIEKAMIKMQGFLFDLKSEIEGISDIQWTAYTEKYKKAHTREIGGTQFDAKYIAENIYEFLRRGISSYRCSSNMLHAKIFINY